MEKKTIGVSKIFRNTLKALKGKFTQNILLMIC